MPADRIRAVNAFANAEFGSDVQMQVRNEEQGQKNKRELTDTALITFINGQARNNALKLLEQKYKKSEGNGFGVSVNIMCTNLVAAQARLQMQKNTELEVPE